MAVVRNYDELSFKRKSPEVRSWATQ